jgi:hypothetical protein
VPRNPKQDANLRPFKSVTEAREKGSRGGKASGRTRRALKTFREALLENLTPAEQKAMLDALKRNAMRGNLPSYEFLLKQIGQHPDQAQDVSDDETGVIILPPILGEKP